MNWNSRTERTIGKAPVEKIRARKPWLGAPRTPAALPEAAILAAVTPPV